MKKINYSVFILAMAVIFSFVACGNADTAKKEVNSDVKVEVEDKFDPNADHNIFTLVFAISDDNFVNLRTEPNSKATIIERIDIMMHGLGQGVLLEEKSGDWVSVKVGEMVGWANSKFLGEQNWYTGTGSKVLVANAPITTIYGEDYTGEGDMPEFTTLEKGTVIADDFQESGEYYMLSTAHDCLYVLKSEVKVLNR